MLYLTKAANSKTGHKFHAADATTAGAITRGAASVLRLRIMSCPSD
jgi:hypothetical protein